MLTFTYDAISSACLKHGSPLSVWGWPLYGRPDLVTSGWSVTLTAVSRCQAERLVTGGSCQRDAYRHTRPSSLWTADTFLRLSLTATGTMQGSFLQARCEQTIMTTDWGLPLIIALLLLGLLYAFLYLPAITQRALLEQALANQTATEDFLPKED